MLIKSSQIVAQAPSAPRTRPVDRSGYGSSRWVNEKSQSEENITPEISLTIPSVLAAFTILCEDISSLPLVLYERGADEERSRAYTHSYYSLLHDTPNPEMTSMTFREIKIGHLLAWGNFYAQKILNQRGAIAELWPLRPDRMMVARMDGEKFYHYVATDGQPYTFLQDEILHIPAFGFDGMVGYSRIALARNSIGLAISAEKFGSKFFANDARPGFVLKHPGTLSDEAYKRLEESWDDVHKGAEKAHKKALLEEGLDIAEIGFPPGEAQFIETQKWTVGQIARVFRVPPHMIGDVERSTSWGSGIDSQEQGYVNHTLRPWTIRTEQALSQQLLLPEERKVYYWEHLFDALMRGDLTTRYGTYVQAITNGIMNPNTVRQKENMAPYEGGEIYTRQLSTGPAKDPQNMTQDTKPQARTRPLFLDAAQRILRRESGELRDAGQRWSAKGKVEKYIAWVEQFYKQDFPVFALATFQPLIEAGLISESRVRNRIQLFCEARGELALDSNPLPEFTPAQFVDGTLEAQ
jgi:HK97 family phage portal protein